MFIVVVDVVATSVFGAVFLIIDVANTEELFVIILVIISASDERDVLMFDDGPKL